MELFWFLFFFISFLWEADNTAKVLEASGKSTLELSSSPSDKNDLSLSELTLLYSENDFDNFVSDTEELEDLRFFAVVLFKVY
ncbi:hypothetical protein U3516DRAFT_888303 [Neocallimastix sp. 'constans']